MRKVHEKVNKESFRLLQPVPDSLSKISPLVLQIIPRSLREKTGLVVAKVRDSRSMEENVCVHIHSLGSIIEIEHVSEKVVWDILRRQKERKWLGLNEPRHTVLGIGNGCRVCLKEGWT